MDMVRGEVRVRCMERVIWKLTLPYVKSNGNLLYISENLNRDSINLEGWDGGDGREVQEEGDICIPTEDSC